MSGLDIVFSMSASSPSPGTVMVKDFEKRRSSGL